MSPEASRLPRVSRCSWAAIATCRAISRAHCTCRRLIMVSTVRKMSPANPADLTLIAFRCNSSRAVVGLAHFTLDTLRRQVSLSCSNSRSSSSMNHLHTSRFTTKIYSVSIRFSRCIFALTVGIIAVNAAREKKARSINADYYTL
jgi:hypothetical protein